MTREEVTKHLNILLANRCWNCRYELAGDKVCDEKCVFKHTVDEAIEALQEVQKHEETFEWCHDCKEYDTKNHCCNRWSKVIRNTVEELQTDRPHGEWIPHATSVGDKKYIEYSRCSECGEMALVRMNYCPNCGARMCREDGET